MSNTEVHEERPKAAAHKRVPTKDGMTEILVQDMPANVSAGDSMINRMERTGWEVIDPKSHPRYDTRVKDYVYMQKPTSDVQAERAKNLSAHVERTKAPVSETIGGVRATSTYGEEALTADEVEALSGSANS